MHSTPAPHPFQSLIEIMTNLSPETSNAWNIADRWCVDKGPDWSVTSQLGLGGTAPVFEVHSPDGPRALKIYDEEFCSGEMGEIEHSRIEQQLLLKDHDCPSLIQVYEGGTFKDRLFLLMSRAPGRELEKTLHEIPRSKIRKIVDEIARACLFLQNRNLCHRDIKAANIFISDDFNHATLLDISVLRAIHDPIGVGSDRDGRLPVLATARYSPPEYLFRLVDPGPQLWHALNVYQLGALLHDLIVRAPLFQAEYEQSKANRYRFAWIVATLDPRIDANDVDHDLLFLARRALDKDWKRRSALEIRQFFDNSNSRQRHAFNMIGLFRPSNNQHTPGVQQTRIRLDETATNLEAHLVDLLQQAAVTAVHQVQPGSDGDNSRLIVLDWSNTDEFGSSMGISLRCTLRHLTTDRGGRFGLSVQQTRRQTDNDKSVDINLPDIPDDENSLTGLAALVESAFGELARDLLQPEKVEQ